MIMAQGYIRSARSNTVVPIDAIACISAPINPDNTFSFKYSADFAGQQQIYLDTATYATQLEALQAGYNALVIELP